MDRLSAQLMIKALDGLSARAVVTAENIANAGTPGYRPLRLSFESALAAAAGNEAAVRAVRPTIDRAPADSPQADLRLDLELATAASTSLRYAALIDLLNRQLQLQSLAISGNN